MQTEVINLARARRVKTLGDTGKPTLPTKLKGKKPIGHVSVPVEYSDAYALQVRGDCLAPTIRDGDQIVCSPSVKLAKGMYVAISFKSDAEGKVKVLDLIPPPPHPDDEIRVMYRGRQTNPPAYYFIDPEKIDCIHAVVGVVRKGKYIALEARRAS